jgi:hypothetical protein
MWQPEIHRIHGLVLLDENKPVESEAAFSQALHLARERQAKSLELRAAASLARLWGEQGRRAEARELLFAGLWLVYRRLRHRRLERSEEAAQRVDVSSRRQVFVRNSTILGTATTLHERLTSRLPRGTANGRFRRVSPVAVRPGEGLLTEPTPAVRPWSREPVLIGEPKETTAAFRTDGTYYVALLKRSLYCQRGQPAIR